MISNGIEFCSYDHIGHCLIPDSFKSSENNGYLMVVLSSAVLFVQLLLLLQLRVSRCRGRPFPGALWPCRG